MTLPRIAREDASNRSPATGELRQRSGSGVAV